MLEAQFASNNDFLYDKVALKENIVKKIIEMEKGVFEGHVLAENQVITTGLLSLRVNSLFFVPLKVNNRIIGVFEFFLSKKPETYKIDFMATISKNIALIMHNIQYQKQQ